MGALANIHSEIVDGLKKHFNLDQVQLKYPLPVRPIRMLGLIGMDGEVYSTDKLLRISCLRISTATTSSTSNWRSRRLRPW